MGKRKRQLKHPPTTSHNYVPKMDAYSVAKWADGTIKPGSIWHMAAYHDDWCDIYRGGFCNCDANIELIMQEPEGSGH